MFSQTRKCLVGVSFIRPSLLRFGSRISFGLLVCFCYDRPLFSRIDDDAAVFGFFASLASKTTCSFCTSVYGVFSAFRIRESCVTGQRTRELFFYELHTNSSVTEEEKS